MLTTIAQRRVRQRTSESYESAVRRHLIPASAGTAATAASGAPRLVCAALLDDDHSPASVLRHTASLFRGLTVAVQRGHVPRDVVALVHPPAQRPSDLATALDPDGARAALEAAARNPAR